MTVVSAVLRRVLFRRLAVWECDQDDADHDEQRRDEAASNDEQDVWLVVASIDVAHCVAERPQYQEPGAQAFKHAIGPCWPRRKEYLKIALCLADCTANEIGYREETAVEKVECPFFPSKSAQ